MCPVGAGKTKVALIGKKTKKTNKKKKTGASSHVKRGEMFCNLEHRGSFYRLFKEGQMNGQKKEKRNKTEERKVDFVLQQGGGGGMLFIPQSC